MTDDRPGGTPFTDIDPEAQIAIARTCESIKTVHDYLLDGGVFTGLRLLLLSMDEQFRRVAALPIPGNTRVCLDNPLSPEAAAEFAEGEPIPDVLPDHWPDQ